MKSDIKTILTYVFGTLLLVAAIGFTSKKNGDRMLTAVQIKILDKAGNFFIDQQEIETLMGGSENGDVLLQNEIRHIDLKSLEARIEENAFVKDAQVYKDVEGHLQVRVSQREPIARLLTPSSPDRYIDVLGNLIPMNAMHTARVPVVETDIQIQWRENINETEFGMKFWDLLSFIYQDSFWRAQISGLIIDKNYEISMIPQVTKQEILFGEPSDIEEKFRKLKLFYKEVLPAKGWNTYYYVNLKYENQIVCK